ncbi:MAG: GNAT family N-acetyltransferase [Polyangiaceae bacterium]|nr:GNAT family N-acetyltransferase [Polyangiaceae bacterium]
MPLPLSPADIQYEALIAPRNAIVPCPDTQIIEKPGFWQIMTPSLPHGGMNEVCCDELPENECDEIVAQIVANYRRLNLQFRWTVGPVVKPADLGERLLRHGLIQSDAFVMACSIDNLTIAPHPRIAVRRVDLSIVDEFTYAMARGWEMPAEPLDAFHRQILADSRGIHHLFLATWDGQPAGASAYISLERSAYMMGGVVIKELRGQGIYTQLVAARAAHAKELGLPIATTVANATTSAPVLRRLGFSEICSSRSYSNR